MANLGSSLNFIFNQSFAIQLLFPWCLLYLYFLFCSAASSGVPVSFSQRKSYFIPPISFSSVTNIFCFPSILFFSFILLSIFYFSGIVPWVFYPHSLASSSLYSVCPRFVITCDKFWTKMTGNNRHILTHSMVDFFFFKDISNPSNLFNLIDIL